MTVSEAAACGTPAVATRIPGHIDVIDHGITGMLGDRDDDAQLAQASFERNPPSLRALFADRRRRRRMRRTGLGDHRSVLQTP